MSRSLSTGLQLVLLAAAIAGVALAPQVLEIFTLMQITLFAAMSILALSLGFIWGFGGILCFGQTAFFGLGGYAYAVAAINLGDSTGAVFVGMLVPAAFAAALGYFMFYGRISDVYLGVITLTVTLILFNLINSTAGDEYRIGAAQLGGFNGMPSVPGLNAPGDPSAVLEPEEIWFVTAGALIAVYVILRLVLVSHFGRVAVAIRENETRASLLGYDPRLYKLLVFVIGGAIAGLAGVLYTNWGAFVSPTIFALSLSAEIIIWITIGGLGTLIGPVLGCVAIQAIVTEIGSQQEFNSNLVLGVILIAFVLLLPRGLVPTAQILWSRALALKARRGGAALFEGGPGGKDDHIAKAAE
ncbi:ABC transporter permease subunit [Arenibaculum pallidiluteum]|uniref:ABC transporter permease subunit n=1 Tax=Arenibaculum pallidiluteum TaxID=2812559 RepID=UPI001A95A30E|nr:branched-chain amino acid ABC transporter permease [Arenibaculum pallidiluteum]